MTTRQARIFRFLSALFVLVLIAFLFVLGKVIASYSPANPSWKFPPLYQAEHAVHPTQIPACTAVPSGFNAATGTPDPSSYGRLAEAGDNSTVDKTPVYEKEGLHLVLDESFQNGEINWDIWHTHFPWGPTNPPELEYYSPDALIFQDGYLRLQADKKPQGDFPYQSGMIASYDRFHFQYGYVEVKARVPKGKGLWPAIWLLRQNPDSPAEIDIMEMLGQDPNLVFSTLHYRSACGGKESIGSGIYGPDFSQDFHTFAVDWNQDRVIWYIDNQEVYRTSDHVPQESMYLIINLAVGGQWPGSPDETTSFPAYFDIAHIRIYSK